MKEPTSTIVQFTWPVRIGVKIASIKRGSNVEFVAANFGFGPIQSSQVKGHLNRVINAVDVLAARARRG